MDYTIALHGLHEYRAQEPGKLEVYQVHCQAPDSDN
jgi:hypothetical protein